MACCRASVSSVLPSPTAPKSRTLDMGNHRIKEPQFEARMSLTRRPERFQHQSLNLPRHVFPSEFAARSACEVAPRKTLERLRLAPLVLWLRVGSVKNLRGPAGVGPACLPLLEFRL